MSIIRTFTTEEIDSFRRGGVILGQCLEHVMALVEPGITTKALDQAAEQFIVDHGGEPAFKGYMDYPATLCTSVNEECVHGIPSERTLSEGDIVAIDCGVRVDGLYTDACRTVAVGVVSPQAQQLMDVTKEALQAVVAIIKAGVPTGDLSHTVQSYAEARGFHPVVSLTGHGLGPDLHLYPDIPNIGEAGTGPKLPANTVIAVEPILSAGSDRVTQSGDGWTMVIADGAPSAHFEHTVLVTEEGCDVLA